MQVAGLNHFIFVRQILHKGKEWLPEVIAEINAGRGSAGAAQHSAVPLAVASAAGLRHDPLRLSALLLHERRSAAPRELAEAGGEGTRGEVVKQLEKILFDQYRDPHRQSNRRRWKGAAASTIPRRPAS